MGCISGAVGGCTGARLRLITPHTGAAVAQRTNAFAVRTTLNGSATGTKGLFQARLHRVNAQCSELDKRCCGSSVAEHTLGKGEVESSILSHSTIFPPFWIARQVCIFRTGFCLWVGCGRILLPRRIGPHCGTKRPFAKARNQGTSAKRLVWCWHDPVQNLPEC